MGKQHNSFKKDIDLLSEAYGSIGAAHTFQDFGNAQQAADHMSAEEGEEHDKTGDDSDRKLLDTVKAKHTAGKDLIDKAESELQHGSLSDHTRDSLARDDYGYGGEDAEEHHHEDESYEDRENQMGAAHGYTGADKGHPTD